MKVTYIYLTSLVISNSAGKWESKKVSAENISDTEVE